MVSARATFVAFAGAPAATDVALLQLDVSGAVADVEAVVTVPLGAGGGGTADDPPPNMFEKKPLTFPGIALTVWPKEDPGDAGAGAGADPSDTVADAADWRLVSLCALLASCRVIVADVPSPEPLPPEFCLPAASAIAAAESPAEPALGPGAGFATTLAPVAAGVATTAGRSGVLPVSWRPAIRLASERLAIADFWSLGLSPFFSQIALVRSEIASPALLSRL